MKSQVKAVFFISLFFLVCTGGLYFAVQTWMPFMWILLFFGGVGVLFTLFQERHLLKEFSGLKTTKYGLNMGSVLILTFCIIVFVNYFSVKFVRILDFSMTGLYTLSDQSKKIIDHLDADLEIKYFYKEGQQNVESTKKAFLALSKVYESYSNKVKVSAVEMNANPSLTEIYGATKGAGDGFVSYKGKISHIESQFGGLSGQIYTEQDFTNGIIKSTRTKFKNVYFLEGHGERNTADEKDEKSISGFKNTLEKNSYIVKNLNLISEGKVPEDADLIIIAGATENFQKSEVTLISEYLSAGRPLLMLFDKSPVSGPTDILSQVGWSLDNTYVFNILTTANGSMVSTDQPTVANMFSSESEITHHFGTSKSALFYRPRPLVMSQASSGFTSDILVKTSDRSVALTKIEATDYTGKPQSFNLGIYVKGKYLKSDKESEIIVISDINLAVNQFFNQTSNKDLLLNSVSFLAKETDLVSLAAKEPSVSKIKMAGPEFNTYFKYILVGLFFPLPVLFLILSLVIWFKRRHA